MDLKRFASKKYLSPILILATLILAVYYLLHHKSLLTNLEHISILTLFIVFVLYIVMLIILSYIFLATTRLLSVKLDFRNNILLNAYSLFMNFFIPGQTGPLYRGYYLKQKYKIKYADFLLATIVYFTLYIIIAVIFILAGSQRYYITILGSLLFSILIYLAIRYYFQKHTPDSLNLSFKNILILFTFTFLQYVIQSIIYYIEINNVDHSVHIGNVITYTGTANLAIFVSLTPGAIGIREAFLIFSERLNHLTSSIIVLANIIDRSVYLIFLIILGLVVILFHVQSKLKVKDK